MSARAEVIRAGQRIPEASEGSFGAGRLSAMELHDIVLGLDSGRTHSLAQGRLDDPIGKAVSLRIRRPTRERGYAKKWSR